MGVRLCYFILLASLWSPGAPRRNRDKPPEVEVFEASARRMEGQVNVDARVRNCGEKPIKRLMVLFDFMDPDRQVITTKRWEDEEHEALDPGDDVQIRARVVDPVRAVEIQLRFEDAEGRGLRPKESKPFPIE